MGWSGACFIRLNRRQNTDAEGEGQTQQSIKVLYTWYGTVHAQKPKGVLVLYFNIDRHVVSHNAIPGSAEYHLKSLNAPNMAPVFNVAFRSAFAHPADLVKYV